MQELEIRARLRKAMGVEARAIGGQNAGYADAEVSKVGAGLAEKSGGGRSFFVGEHGGVGDTAVIVDGHVEEPRPAPRVSSRRLPVRRWPGLWMRAERHVRSARWARPVRACGFCSVSVGSGYGLPWPDSVRWRLDMRISVQRSRGSRSLSAEAPHPFARAQFLASSSRR